MIILDTDVLIEIEHGNEKVRRLLSDLRGKNQGDLVTTSAAYAEFVYGFVTKMKLIPPQIGALEVIDFDKESASILAEKQHELEKKGTQIPIFDLITASCALSRNAIVVSFDRHFRNVSGLNTIIFERD